MTAAGKETAQPCCADFVVTEPDNADGVEPETLGLPSDRFARRAHA
jgi:hypothetical protein